MDRRAVTCLSAAQRSAGHPCQVRMTNGEWRKVGHGLPGPRIMTDYLDGRTPSVRTTGGSGGSAGKVVITGGSAGGAGGAKR